MKGMKLIFIIFLALPLLFAVSGVRDLTVAMGGLCSGLTSMLPVAAMLMTVLAAVIYASGQMTGTETRARTNVWATAAITGAMMAVLIAVVSPSVLGAVSGGKISCGTGTLNYACPNGNECGYGYTCCTDPIAQGCGPIDQCKMNLGGSCIDHGDCITGACNQTVTPYVCF